MAVSLRSWLASANAPGTDFPLLNLPYGVFTARGRPHEAHIGVAIGDQILDLAAAAVLLKELSPEIVAAVHMPALNRLMGLGPSHWAALRKWLMASLHEDAPAEVQRAITPLLVPMEDAVMQLPASIGDYSDFYASIYHATRVGRLFRPDSPLMPNYKYIPIGYHGRSSSICVSGTKIQRPLGQTKPADAEHPVYGPSRSLDYELEVGIFTGPGNASGESIAMPHAESHIFGFCLLNDWSARDIQSWEYQPLGPFLSKNFATTISPWIVTMEALRPFRVPAFARAAGDPAPLPYLDSPQNQAGGGFNVQLTVHLSSRKMRSAGLPPVRVSHSNLRDLYWTPAQLLVHHASNGCNLQPGDLLGTGTVSGAADEACGCLLEMTARGAKPLQLPSGEQRAFLEDGDEVILHGYCEGAVAEREGAGRIGFGECRGVVAE